MAVLPLAQRWTAEETGRRAGSFPGYFPRAARWTGPPAATRRSIPAARGVLRKTARRHAVSRVPPPRGVPDLQKNTGAWIQLVLLLFLRYPGDYIPCKPRQYVVG